MILEARKIGILTPIIYFVKNNTIIMEYIDGMQLKKIINVGIAKELGRNVGLLHKYNIIHGDLTTSNILVTNNNYKQHLYFIDFGLSYIDKNIESKGVDIHVLFQTLESTHHNIYQNFVKEFILEYKLTYKDAIIVLKRAEEIKKRGRYM